MRRALLNALLPFALTIIFCMHINLLLSLVSATTQHVLHIAATQQLSKVYANKIAYGFLFYYFAPCKFPLILEKESYYSLFLLASAPASSVEATNAKVKAKLRLCPLLSTWDDLDLGKKAAPKLFMHRIPIKNSISFSSSTPHKSKAKVRSAAPDAHF